VLSWRDYLLAVVALFTISSLITAGQRFQDEVKVYNTMYFYMKVLLQSENMFLKFTATEWYTWNIRNRKKLVLVLMNTAQPLQLKFSESFVINFDLLVFVSNISELFFVSFSFCFALQICKALYSVLSILVKVKYN
jgi:hypothetical protein